MKYTQTHRLCHIVEYPMQGHGILSVCMKWIECMHACKHKYTACMHKYTNTASDFRVHFHTYMYIHTHTASEGVVSSTRRPSFLHMSKASPLTVPRSTPSPVCVYIYYCVCVYIYIHTHAYIHTYVRTNVLSIKAIQALCTCRKQSLSQSQEALSRRIARYTYTHAYV